jgi:hypothetical protein
MVKGSVSIEPPLLLLLVDRPSWLGEGGIKGFTAWYRRDDGVTGARGIRCHGVVPQAGFFEDRVRSLVVVALGILVSLRLLTLGLNNIIVLGIAGSSLEIFVNNILITLIYNMLFKDRSC